MQQISVTCDVCKKPVKRFAELTINVRDFSCEHIAGEACEPPPVAWLDLCSDCVAEIQKSLPFKKNQ